MAGKIKREHLEHLSNKQIAAFYATKNISIMPKEIRDHYRSFDCPYSRNAVITRICNVLNVIIIRRFINQNYTGV